MHILTLLRIPSPWMDDYQAYLQSDAWKCKRREVLKRDNWHCTRCNAKDSLQVHHLSYRYIGREPLRDLTTLCMRCHEKAHAIEGNKTAKVVFK